MCFLWLKVRRCFESAETETWSTACPRSCIFGKTSSSEMCNFDSLDIKKILEATLLDLKVMLQENSTGMLTSVCNRSWKLNGS